MNAYLDTYRVEGDSIHGYKVYEYDDDHNRYIFIGNAFKATDAKDAIKELQSFIEGCDNVM